MKNFLTIFSFFILIFFIASCSSSDEKKLSRDVMNQNKLAPGTAKVTGEITNLEEQENMYVCTIKVTKIYGYGMATPAIGKNSELQVQFIKKKNHDFDSKLALGRKYDFILRSYDIPGGNSSRWRGSIID